MVAKKMSALRCQVSVKRKNSERLIYDSASRWEVQKIRNGEVPCYNSAVLSD
ncbi:hypothetical protein KIN20_020755 [Parelaphostrongylus tenuis]|uniref:Uncharacterized protein n=1 Tax=Parelaphostrongylus tenuis TaxID=148309 RepID=A0AAD5N4H0_PARTN|nr:hypothetical protein KIN20_020755 [Parelaphostrongylus tenuis]